MPAQADLDQAKRAYRDLLDRARTLVFGTLSADGVPGCGMAPFIQHGGSFYVYVSQLAAHTRQLLDLDRTQVMVIEDEAAAKQIFARQRANFVCTVEVVAREDAAYQSVLDNMETRFGAIIGVLRSLPDFLLFRLSPLSGRFVSGFAAAYDIGGPGLDVLTPVGPTRGAS